jgi:hypothetical protein
MGAVYAEADTTVFYDRLSDPGGPNSIVMFKSCYPNSAVRSDNGEPASALFGRDASSSAHTLSNVKEVYRRILAYMKTKPDRMFVVITAPPLVEGATNSTQAANARAFNDWLVSGWLSKAEGDWENRNVYVFDFFAVLTDGNNHHRVHLGTVQHESTQGTPYAAYATSASDSHPTATGNGKATTEFPPLLNVYYHRWRDWLATQ